MGFTNIDQVNSDPIQAEYYIFPEKEIWDLEDDKVHVNDDGAYIPIEYKDKELKEWLEASTIEDAINYLKRYHDNTSLMHIAQALRYYYDNDAFME